MEKETRKSKVHRFSQGGKFYSPKKPERKKPALLVVDQYLRKAGHDRAVSDLVKSMFKKEVMTFEEWGKKVNALLKKKV